jgi:hypothetical protein
MIAQLKWSPADKIRLSATYSKGSIAWFLGTQPTGRISFKRKRPGVTRITLSRKGQLNGKIASPGACEICGQTEGAMRHAEDYGPSLRPPEAGLLLNPEIARSAEMEGRKAVSAWFGNVL